MWRVVNFRCFLFVALSCIITVSLSLLDTSVFIIISAILATLILGAGIFAIVKKDGVKAVTAFLCAIFMLVVAINTLVCQNAWVNELDGTTVYTCTGKIERVDNDLDESKHTFKLEGLSAGEIITVNSALPSIHSSLDGILDTVYQKFSKYWLRLADGDNTLTVSNNCIMKKCLQHQ